MNVQERVARGATLLDEHEPGWELKIDLGTLALESCYQCVLGQLFGHFDEGVEELFLDKPMGSSVGYGFCGPLDGYDRLNDEWTRVIKERLDRGIDLGD